MATILKFMILGGVLLSSGVFAPTAYDNKKKTVTQKVQETAASRDRKASKK